MQSVNLMPPDLQRRRFLLDRARMWGILTAIVAAGAVTSNRAMESRIGVLQKQVADESTRELEFAAAQATIETLKERQARYAAKHEVLRRLMRPSGWEDVVRDVADAAGSGVWLNKLRLRHEREPGGPSTDAMEDRGRPVLRLSGFAVSNSEFAAFLGRLNQCRSLTNAEPTAAKMERLFNGRLIEFSVTCQVVSVPNRRGAVARRIAPSAETRLAVVVDASKRGGGR